MWSHRDVGRGAFSLANRSPVHGRWLLSPMATTGVRFSTACHHISEMKSASPGRRVVGCRVAWLGHELR